MPVAVLMLAGCGGSGSSPAAPTPAPPVAVAPPAPQPTPPAGPPTVTVTAAGISPLVITIDVGQRVTFVNNDNRPHDFAGGPDPSRPECREIDVAGFLVPGQSRDTAAFPVARTCVYHDHSMLGVPAFSGTIIIR